MALLALFIALGGPATAARLIDGRSIRKSSITSAQIRNRSLGTQDLSRTAVKTLQATRAGSVGTRQLAAKAVDATKLADNAVGPLAIAPGAVDGSKLGDGAVGPVQLGASAVTSSKIADGAVGSAAIADGGLQVTDLADVYGSVVVDFAPFKINECQKAEVTPTPVGNLAAQINDDIVIVTPQPGWSDLITVSGNPGANNVLRLIACRVGVDPANVDPANEVDPPATRFTYMGIDT
ncbi:hypothetical protein FSW04_05035 [Baekduia soli]|uniref:Uncharacterized protein n=1 Tax=Baekduia soli TaxID=496014 RepID=A0A5B8U1S5_9ACTN|nr:hypothetical protein [Baekduia soli]QEC47014.1 hypothetical protein FSW04_05035 [Baekduia soli]